MTIQWYSLIIMIHFTKIGDCQKRGYLIFPKCPTSNTLGGHSQNNSDGGSKKYQLTVDGAVVSTHDTLDKAFKARNDKVRELCYNLVEDGIMDKYGAEDWCWNLEQNKNLEFYIDEGCGYQVNIVEVSMK